MLGQINPPAATALALVFALLLLATGVVRLLQRRFPERNFQELHARIVSWWWMALSFSVALALALTTAFLALVSFLALKEYFSLIPTRRVDRHVLFFAYLAIPVQYYFVAIASYGLFIVFVPVYLFLLLPLLMVIIGEPHGFLRAAGTLHWGLMIAVFSLGHAALLLTLPEQSQFLAGGVGLLLYLVMLTELNDISQYLWGKALGRHKVVPTISPNKTWEGLLGGVGNTVLLALLLAPLLTPFDPIGAALIGLLIATAGFFGDVTISALKRDLGIKDSGSLLPGHGGILDRVDSLIYTAPLFFHVTRYFYYP
jgi:phosphatidate cytidylyltransferase